MLNRVEWLLGANKDKQVYVLFNGEGKVQIQVAGESTSTKIDIN